MVYRARGWESRWRRRGGESAMGAAHDTEVTSVDRKNPRLMLTNLKRGSEPSNYKINLFASAES